MKSSEIRELSDNDLKERLELEQGALASVKFNHSVSTAENPMEIRERRKTIARLQTEISARKNKA